MTFNANAAQEQWRTRPADQCFPSIDAALAHSQHIMQHSQAKVIPSKSLQADIENNALVIRGPSGKATQPSHWAFGQLCARVGVPAGFVRKLLASRPHICPMRGSRYPLRVGSPAQRSGKPQWA